MRYAPCMRRALPFLALVLACTHPSHPIAMPPSVLVPPVVPVQTEARVMILGVYHFDNPGLDAVKSDLDDHTAPERQAQIGAVITALATFKPTKILVESDDQAHLTAAYAGARDAKAPLGSDEVDQLGLRLAIQLGLPGVGAIDHQMGMDFDRLTAAAQATHDPFVQTFAAAVEKFGAEATTFSSHTVMENLRALNDPARFPAERDLYLTMARVKNGDDFAGPDVLAGWYQRNFRIFASLAAAVTSPEDRVLVIFGEGHAAILRDLVAASHEMVLVEPNDYLR